MSLTHSPPPRILLVCNLFTMAYRVMRCARAAGADVYVLGNAGSAGFRSSHCPNKYIQSSAAFNGTPTQEALDEINRCIAAFGIDMVLPGDAPSTRTVVALKDRINAPCFPLPDLAQFDTLNDKWVFAGICRDLGIPTPATRLFDTKDALLHAIDTGEISFPSMAKALAMDGNHGIYRLDAQNARAIVETINYRPLLVQDFIPGADIGASVYCEQGKIRSYILHRQENSVYSTFDNGSVFDALSRFMQHMGVSGIYNFDMRLAEDGRIYYLECNPRVFYKISLSMLAGVNFIRPGLPGGTINAASAASGIAVPVPSRLLLKHMLKRLITPWRWHITRYDLAMLAYTIVDPLPLVRELLRMDPEHGWVDLKQNQTSL